MSMQDSSNWEQLLSIMPNGAEDGDIIDNLPKSNIFNDIISLINKQEIDELRSIVEKSIDSNNTPPGVKAKAKLKLEFWTDLLPEALNKTIGAGTYNKLSQLIDAIDPPASQRVVNG